MNAETYDVLFSGLLLPGATPELVKRRLRERLGLTGTQADALFSAGTQTVQRGLDAESAAHYESLFRSVGALVELSLQPAGTKATGSDPATEDLSLAPADVSTPLDPAAARPNTAVMPDTHDLALAPPGGPLVGEAAPPPRPPTIDTSDLKLQEGRDWSLDDARNRTPEPPPPDTGHLSLEAPGEDDGNS